jgi:hypothetical protein
MRFLRHDVGSWKVSGPGSRTGLVAPVLSQLSERVRELRTRISDSARFLVVADALSFPEAPTDETVFAAPWGRRDWIEQVSMEERHQGMCSVLARI